MVDVSCASVDVVLGFSDDEGPALGFCEKHDRDTEYTATRSPTEKDMMAGSVCQKIDMADISCASADINLGFSDDEGPILSFCEEEDFEYAAAASSMSEAAKTPVLTKSRSTAPPKESTPKKEKDTSRGIRTIKQY